MIMTAFRASSMAILAMRRGAVPVRLATLGVVIAGLVVAEPAARHTVLAVLVGLGFLAAGAGFLLRFRVTGTRTAFHVGCGLTLFGLHRPAMVAIDALLGERLRDLAYATGLLLVLAAAVACFKAVPSRRPRYRAATAGALTAAALGMAVVPLLPIAAVGVPVARVAHGTCVVLAGVLWATVAAAAWRDDSLGAGDRTANRTLAGIAMSIGALGLLHAVPAVLPGTAVAVQTAGDVALLGVAVVAVVTAVRRLTDSLAGQERYVAGLLGQLAGHERHLQATRACLHDARAAVAGVRAGCSAIRHVPAADDASVRVGLEEAVAAELARLERMLRLPERPAAPALVDLDELLRPLVVSHRERGLRVAWAPVEVAPVLADGDAVAVIVSNLLGNALVHAPRAHCEVTVELGDRLTVTVSDDGPGLPPSRRFTAFEAGARRTGSPGEGLGLAISRDLARRHGGDLTAETPERGSRFVLTLPLVGEPASVAVLTPRAPAAAALLGSAA